MVATVQPADLRQHALAAVLQLGSVERQRLVVAGDGRGLRLQRQDGRRILDQRGLCLE